jgi:hypothetical protein
MKRPRENRYRAAGALTLAIAMGVLATVGALAGIAVAKDGGHRVEKRHGHHHRHHSHQPSGTIQSFDSATGRLTIVLTNQETVSGLVTDRTRISRGLVTDRTRIRCEDEHSPDITASRTHLRHGEEEPGDDRGGHGEEPGDDNGGHGEEPGDDNGGGDKSGSGSSNSGSGPSGHDDNGTGANCTASDLIVGAVVTDAELEIEHGGATWDEVELAG